MNAQLVTSIASESVPPAGLGESVFALKQLRWKRESATIERELERLQQAGIDGPQVTELLIRKTAVKQQIEETEELWRQRNDRIHGRSVLAHTRSGR